MVRNKQFKIEYIIVDKACAPIGAQKITSKEEIEIFNVDARQLTEK